MSKEKNISVPIDIEDLILSTLGNATRREILKLIKKNPDITYTEIMKAMKLDTGTLNYHLSKMSDFITKNDNKYQLSKLGKIAVDTIDFLHSQTLLSKEHAYFLFNNFIILRLGDIFLTLFRPHLAFKKITDSNVRNYLPLSLIIFLLTNLMSIITILVSEANTLLAVGSNMVTLTFLILFLPVLIVKTVEILWQNKKSYLDVATLLMISYTPAFLYNILYLSSYLPFFADIKSALAFKLTLLSFLGFSLSSWSTLIASLILLFWTVYLFYTSIRIYFNLSRGQTLVILIFSGFLYFLIESVILLAWTLFFFVITD